MAKVFADGNEIACKAGGGKVIAAFPDVCLSPPSPPAGPIPVPYPDTSFSKDMKNGSKTVKISKKEVMLKDKSYYKSSPLGNEAATRSFGAGLITHVITGKTYFAMWSMDVKFEGKNVDRHVDITTSNHASPLTNVPVPQTNIATATLAQQLAEQDICPCCNRPLHSDGPIITEAQFYGTEDIIFADDNGDIQVLDKHPNGENLLRQVREECPELLPEPPCNIYQVATAEENAAIYADFRDGAVHQYRAKHRMRPGQTVAHRTPRCAGGCPSDEKNLSPVSSRCADMEHRLGAHQGRRIEDLRPLWGR